MCLSVRPRSCGRERARAHACKYVVHGIKRIRSTAAFARSRAPAPHRRSSPSPRCTHWARACACGRRLRRASSPRCARNFLIKSTRAACSRLSTNTSLLHARAARRVSIAMARLSAHCDFLWRAVFIGGLERAPLAYQPENTRYIGDFCTRVSTTLDDSAVRIGKASERSRARERERARVLRNLVVVCSRANTRRRRRRCEGERRSSRQKVPGTQRTARGQPISVARSTVQTSNEPDEQLFFPRFVIALIFLSHFCWCLLVGNRR